MKPKSKKTRFLGVRIPEQVARKLDEFENRSEPVKEALQLYFDFYKQCPACGGTGRVTEAQPAPRSEPKPKPKVKPKSKSEEKRIKVQTKKTYKELLREKAEELQQELNFTPTKPN